MIKFYFDHFDCFRYMLAVRHWGAQECSSEWVTCFRSTGNGIRCVRTILCWKNIRLNMGIQRVGYYRIPLDYHTITINIQWIVKESSGFLKKPANSSWNQWILKCTRGFLQWRTWKVLSWIIILSNQNSRIKWNHLWWWSGRTDSDWANNENKYCPIQFHSKILWNNNKMISTRGKQ